MAIADTTKPVLTSLDFVSTVDVTTGGKYVTFTAGATDTGLGVSYVSVIFDHSWQGQYGNDSSLDAFDSTDSFSDGLSSSREYIDPTSGSGTYNISRVYVYDKAGNYSYYTAADLESLGIATSFEIESLNTIDTTKPVLTSLDFVSTVDVTTGGKYVTFTAGATDTGLGVSYVSVIFDHSWQGQYGNDSSLDAFDSTDSFSDGLSSSREYIDPTSGSGTYNISRVYVYDKAGNYSYYTAADLESLGIGTSFEVIDKNAGVTATVNSASVVSEGVNGSFTPSLTLHAVGNYIGQVSVTFDADNSTISLKDANVPSFSGSYSIAQSPAGDYVIELPTISIVDDLAIEGDEVLAFRVSASGRIFDSGSDNDIIKVTIKDNDRYGTNADDIMEGDAGNNHFVGLSGDDQLFGAAGADRLVGDAGDDLLDGGQGSDTMLGGLGNDIFVVDQAGDKVFELAGEGFDTVNTSISYALAANVESLRIIGAKGAIDAHGNGADNWLNALWVDVAPTAGTQIRLYGEGGDDNLLGSRYGDLLDGGTGADKMTGGNGNDTYVVDNVGDMVVEKAGAGFDTVNSSISYTLAANVESLRLIDVTGAVDAHGNNGNNWLNALWVDAEPAAGTMIRLYGEGGNDNLIGSRYGDLLDGGTGADKMTGGNGNDTYVVDNASDIVVEKAGQGFDTVNSSISYTLGANVESLRLIDVTGAVDAHGNGAKNWLNALWVDVEPAAGTMIRLYGEGGDDTLIGSRYGDLLDGGAGADQMTGGDGNDSYVVNDARDVVIEKAGQGFDTVDASVSYNLSANVESLRFIGTTGAVTAHGNNGNNWLSAIWVDVEPAAGTMIRLYGEGGDDRLTGSRYGDLLDGGAGSDMLRGGGGRDRFHFGDRLDAATNVDTILDFQKGIDRIELDDSVFAGLDLGKLDASAFVANATGVATSADQRIIYDTDSGQLFYDADGSLGGAAVLFGIVAGHPPLTGADFVVV